MRRNRFRSLFLIILIICLGIVAGLLGELFPTKIQESLKDKSVLGLPYEWFWVISIVFVCALSIAVMFIKERFDSTDETARANIHESEEEKERRKISADLYKRYKELYDHKLDGRSEIPLLVSDESKDTHAQQLEEAMPCIIRRFEHDGRLLLVGGAGSGKTVLLLNLATYLAEKAQTDANQPLPFVFNLATWSRDYAHFNDWATATLTKAYGLSTTVSGQLLTDRRVVFLLDGLDELARPEKFELDDLDELARAKKLECAATVRAECLASLNVALHHGSISIVICCRPDELKLMRQRPDLRPPWAVGLKVHSLTPEQIDRALIRAGVNATDRFAAPNINAALGTDSAGVYQQVLSIPFYFTTAMQVFDPTISPLVDASDEEKFKASLVVAFIEKKLQLPENNVRRFPQVRTLDWLAWLADFLKGRVTFELSDLQPSTLRRMWLYRLLFSLCCGVFGGLVTGLYSREPGIGLFFGGLFSLTSVYIISEDFGRWTFAPLRRWSTWLISLLFGFVIALSAGFLLLLGMLTEGNAASDPAFPIYAFGTLIVVMLPAGILGFIAALGVRLFIRVAFGIKGGVPLSKIVTEDFSHWTLRSLLRLHKWREVLQSGVEGGVAGLFVVNILGFLVMIAFIVLLIFYMVQGRLVAPKLGELFVGLIMAPVIIIVTGLIGFTIGFIIGILLGIPKVCRETDRFVSIHLPYQRLRAGIFLNILQTALVGWNFYFLFRLFDVPAYWYGTKEFHFSLLLPSLPILLVFGMIGLFRTPLLKHLILRVCLTLEGALPLHAASFLNYATDLGILERDGGQWRFRHQILQDHFARRNQDGDSNLTQT